MQIVTNFPNLLAIADLNSGKCAVIFQCQWLIARLQGWVAKLAVHQSTKTTQITIFAAGLILQVARLAQLTKSTQKMPKITKYGQKADADAVTISSNTSGYTLLSLPSSPRIGWSFLYQQQHC